MGAEGSSEPEKNGEDRVAAERAKPISEAQFLSWKRQKDAAASSRKAEEARKREEDITAGIVPMNGRELFLHEPWVFDNSCY